MELLTLIAAGILIVLFFILFVLILIVPIMIAKNRGITGSDYNVIVILSWLGIFFGITWIVALIMSLIWNGSFVAGSDNLDKLEKLSKLYKDKVISKEEFEKMKKKLLNS